MDANPYDPPEQCEQHCRSIKDDHSQQLGMLILHAASVGYGLRSLLYPSGRQTIMAIVFMLCVNVLCVIILTHIIKRLR